MIFLSKIKGGKGMGKARKKTATTIGLMTMFAIIVLMFYFYWTHRTDPLEETSVDELSEYEKIMNVDLELYYPETPRETVKLFARIMKALYNDPKDAEVEPLAMKIRELYDKDFLANNPEETYLKNLKSDIASWKDKDRRITNYLLVNEELEKESVVEGVKYSVNYVSYTIQENGKFTETWKVLLRQDENKKWKIIGWEFVPAEDAQG
jgi:hypothetical protein